MNELDFVKSYEAFGLSPACKSTIESLFRAEDVRRADAVLKEFGHAIFISEKICPDECNSVGAAEAALSDCYLWNLSTYIGGDRRLSEEDFKKMTSDKPVIAVTDLNGFRSLEAEKALCGLLRFILCDKIPLGTKREGKAVLIGASSLLGNTLFKTLQENYTEVIGTGFKKAFSQGFTPLDITDKKAVQLFFEVHKDADVVIYVSGESNADIAEKEHKHTYRLNTEPVKLIAEYFSGTFVYASTEYVFDGDHPPYTSLSNANPKNYYGRTKLEAESLIKQSFEKFLILRLGALYGYNGPQDKKTTVSSIAESLDKNIDFEVDFLQIKHPILLEDVSDTVVRLLDYGVSGIYALNGAVGFNKLRMAEIMSEVRNESAAPFTAEIKGHDTTDMSNKPFNTMMLNIDTPRSFEEGIRFMYRKMKARDGKNLSNV